MPTLGEAWVKVGLDDKEVLAGSEKLRAKVDASLKKISAIRLNVDDKAAVEKITRMRLQLDTLSKKVAKPEIDVQGVLRAEASIARIDLALDKLGAKTARPNINARGGLLGSIGAIFSGAGGGAGGASALVPGGASAFSNPYVLGGAIAAGLAASPFLAQILSGGIVTALGGGLAGLGIAGSLVTGKAPTAVSASQLAAAQLRVTAAQDRVNALTRKSTTASVASAQAGLASAQGSLAKLQAQAAKLADFLTENKLQLQVRKAFKALADDAKDSLRQIGTSFVPVMLSIFRTADGTLKKLTPVFAGAVAQISGPFQRFADAFIKAFAQPAMVAAISEISTAFVAILQALTPQLPGIIKTFGDGLVNVSKAVQANPKAFADFLAFMLKLPGYLLDGLAALTKVANWVEAHWNKIGPLLSIPITSTVAIFKVAFAVIGGLFRFWLDIFRLRWGAAWNDLLTIGKRYWNIIRDTLVKIWHVILTEAGSWLDGLRHGISAHFDEIRHDIAHWWDVIFNNTIGRVQRGIADIKKWFGTLPGKILDALVGLGADLWGLGKRVLGDFLTGVKKVWTDVESWFKGLPSKILGALGIHSPPSWAIDAGRHVMGGLLRGIAHGAADVKSFFVGLASDITGPLRAVWNTVAGGFVHGTSADVVKWLTAAMGDTGAPAGWLPALEQLVSRESGGVPNAVNPVAVMGEHAEGLLQMLPSTYAQFATVGGGIFDPISNAVAAIRYIQARYGSPFNIPNLFSGPYVGYDAGGILPPGYHLVANLTGRPEQVVPWHGTRSASHGTAAGGTVIVNVSLSNHGVIGSEYQVRAWLSRQIDALARTGQLAYVLRRSPSLL